MWPRYPVICHSRNKTKKKKKKEEEILKSLKDQRDVENGEQKENLSGKNYLYKFPSARRAELCFPVCVFAADGRAGGEAPGSASGLETVAAALFPASRSPAVPLSAGGLASQTLEQPNSDKTTRLLSTLPRRRRSGRERPRIDKPSPLGFDPPSRLPPPFFYPSSSSSFSPAPFPPRACRHSRPYFL